MTLMGMIGDARRIRGVQEFLRFVAVGVATFFVNLGSLYFFLMIFGHDYRVAVSLAYAVTVLCHFLTNRIFTFKAQTQQMSRNAVLYALMLCVNYGSALTVSWLVIGLWAWPAYVAVICYTAANAMVSFLAMKFIVFRPPAASRPS